MRLHWLLFVSWLSASACTGRTPAQPATPEHGAPAAADGVSRLDASKSDGWFYPGASHDPAITAPDACVGFPLGERLAAPDRIVACFHQWAKESPRVVVERSALSYEGRELIRAIITAPKNHQRLPEILQNLARVADPRGISEAEIERIVATSPAVGWFGYSIHGDEVSGADASLAFGYHLVAGTSAEVNGLLDDLVVVIDPVMNPDGRQRIISLVQQHGSQVANLNTTSMHRGRWPWGRGNHYLFDMNRDWIIGKAPETRGRWQGVLKYHPQLFVDAHEMGPQDTYLFYPYAEPTNRNFAATLARWQAVFAADHSRAFDRYGWPYYTREWADGWYPGYSDGWNSLNGAVGILYEQATTTGQTMMRASGQVVTYRETVHAQAVSSLANATTLARNRRAVLRDYAAFRRAQVRRDGQTRAFALVPGRHPDRERHLLRTLMRQGIEVHRAESTFTGRDVTSSLGQRAGKREFPAGTYLILSAQPQRGLVRSLLDFDVRMDEAFLVKERQELIRKGQSKIFDLTAWSLGLSFGLDTHWLDDPRGRITQVTEVPGAAGKLLPLNRGDPVAWVVDGKNDASVAFAVSALEAKITLYVADTTFSARGRQFSAGSLLVRRSDNRADIAQHLGRIATALGVSVHAVATGRSPDDGPDLGGRHFHLLHRPRIALLANSPVTPSGYGHMWEHLDQVLGAPISILDAQSLGRYHLRRYNVLIIPESFGGLQMALKPHIERLKSWLAAGGTLIAVGRSAAQVAAPAIGLSRVQLRRHALGALPLYRVAVARELANRTVQIDRDTLWDEPESRPDRDKKPAASPGQPGGAMTGAPARSRTGASASQGASGPGGGPSQGPSRGPSRGMTGPMGVIAAERDGWLRRFAPRGAVARGLVDRDHWIAFGAPDQLPVWLMGDWALMSREPVRTPVRLGAARGLRLSGLLWPEARERLAHTGYVTVESVGRGQVVLFAASPTFRGLLASLARMFSHAAIYGPSLGTKRPLRW